MTPRKASRKEQRRSADYADREASVYVRTVLETMRDVTYLPSQDMRGPHWSVRSSGSADRLRLRWLMAPVQDGPSVAARTTRANWAAARTQPVTRIATPVTRIAPPVN
jgi:hypothetical protein